MFCEGVPTTRNVAITLICPIFVICDRFELLVYRMVWTDVVILQWTDSFGKRIFKMREFVVKSDTMRILLTKFKVIIYVSIIRCKDFLFL